MFSIPVSYNAHKLIDMLQEMSATHQLEKINGLELQETEFVALDIEGKNYISCILDTESSCRCYGTQLKKKEKERKSRNNAKPC